MRNYSALTAPLEQFLSSKEVSLAWAVQGPFYLLTSFLVVMDHEKWNEFRTDFLKRIIACVHAREISLNPKAKLGSLLFVLKIKKCTQILVV